MLEASSSLYIGSGSKISSGVGNIVIGAGGTAPAGQALTTGYQNIIIGPGSGDVITTGLENTIVGSSANGSGNTQRTTAIGFATLRTSTSTTGAKNTAIGWLAGSGNQNASPYSQSLLAGVENVFVGAQSGIISGSATVNNTVVIGFGALSSGSNTVVIGNDSITSTYLKGSVNANSFTGSVLGTASYALEALTASYAMNGGGGSPLTSGSLYNITSSWAVTASYAMNATATTLDLDSVWIYSGI